MAEYWKSTPKYWCKHCATYVKDTKFERTQHEATGKHQGNLKRFLRGVHQEREREERETQRAKNEVDRLKGLVGGSPAISKSTVATASSARPIAPIKQATVADRKKQMAQLADMGIVVPNEFRGDLALAGEWEQVSAPSIPTTSTTSIGVGVKRKKLDDGEEGEDVAEVTTSRRGWGSSTRAFPALKEDQDLEMLLATNLLPKKEPLGQSNEHTGCEPQEVHGDRPTVESTDDKDVINREIKAPEVVEGKANVGKDAIAANPLFKKRKSKFSKNT